MSATPIQTTQTPQEWLFCLDKFLQEMWSDERLFKTPQQVADERHTSKLRMIAQNSLANYCVERGITL